MENLIPISITSITDISQQRAISGRVYIQYYFITDGVNVFQHRFGTMQCNANIEVVRKIYPNFDIIQLPFAIVPDKIGTTILGG